MTFDLIYDKRKTIHAIRLHFVSKGSVKWLVILINVFAAISSLLYYLKYVTPYAFILGSLLWILFMPAIWFLMPYSVYKKSDLLQSISSLTIGEWGIDLKNQSGEIHWEWSNFKYYLDSINFLYLYMDEKTFLLIPKQPDQKMQSLLENIVSQKVART